MIKLRNPAASLFVPEGVSQDEALARVTHAGIGAHQDDLEIMAIHGIVACRKHADLWFGGITCSDGRGSPRSGPYASMTDDEMQALRRGEQEQAAALGDYSVMAQLAYSSAAIKTPGAPDLVADLEALLRAMHPSVVYTHNLADKHPTHVAVGVAAIEAIRALPAVLRPGRVFGCEVWRNLDWMPDGEKIPFDLTGHGETATRLARVFDSQIAGGKRYDLATLGRWRANATYFQSHATDDAEYLTFAMELTPLAKDDSIDIAEYVLGYIDRFRDEVRELLERRLGRQA